MKESIKLGEIAVAPSRMIMANIVVLVAAFAVGSPALAHEFWMSLERGRVGPGEEIRADLKVGRMLEGVSHPYLSKRFRKFTIGLHGKEQRVVGNEGDLPALAQAPIGSGLHVISHHTIAFRVVYDDWSLFRRYLSEEGLDHLAARHRERGLPETGFAERYTRYAKALVQVGDIREDDRDAVVGMRLELVADANPYDPNIEALPVRLIWRGAPMAGRQINIFRDDGGVTRTSVKTDADGRAVIAILGDGDYLLNAVLLLPVENQPVVWSSHWASLTFNLSGRQVTNIEQARNH